MENLLGAVLALKNQLLKLAKDQVLVVLLKNMSLHNVFYNRIGIGLGFDGRDI